MLGELESNGRIVIADLEAGVGAVVRAGHADLVLVVANPTAKSIEVARRAVEITAGGAELLVIANRVAGEEDLEAIRAVLGDRELVVVPEEPVIAAAEREGDAPIDIDDTSPGVQAIVGLAERLAARAASAAH